MMVLKRTSKPEERVVGLIKVSGISDHETRVSRYDRHGLDAVTTCMNCPLTLNFVCMDTSMSGLQ